LEYEDVDLAAVVRDVTARFDDDLRRAGCSLSMDADAPVLGRSDPTRLEQIVTNLLSNAVKYGAGKPIEVAVASAGDAARVVVRDRGIGIARTDHRRIFERFERLSGTNVGGFGLGLWIVREIVQALGGTIR